MTEKVVGILSRPAREEEAAGPVSSRSRNERDSMEVQVKHDDIDKALRLLKKKIQQEGVLHELKIREGFLSRVERRKMKDSLAAKRRMRKERRRYEV